MAAEPGAEGEDEAVVAREESTALPGGDQPDQPPGSGAGDVSWPDESSEAVFLAEARGRGEVPAPPPAAVMPAVEIETQPLPPLDELVERIPPEVRAALDDLFRAKFVRVVRVPENALKG